MSKPDPKVYDQVSLYAAYDALCRTAQVHHVIDAEQVLAGVKKNLAVQLANEETRPFALKLIAFFEMMVRHKQEIVAFGPTPRPLMDRSKQREPGQK